MTVEEFVLLSMSSQLHVSLHRPVATEGQGAKCSHPLRFWRECSMPGHGDDEGHKHWVFEYDPGKEDTALLLTM